MSPFQSTPARRRTVYTVLLVWFFALGSGWVNACLLQERSTHWDEPSADASEVRTSRMSPGHIGVDSHHPENAGTAKSVCLKVCGDDIETVIKWASSVDSENVVMGPPHRLMGAQPRDTAEASYARLELTVPSPGVPLRTRYSRLVL